MILANPTNLSSFHIAEVTDFNFQPNITGCFVYWMLCVLDALCTHKSVLTPSRAPQPISYLMLLQCLGIPLQFLRTHPSQTAYAPNYDDMVGDDNHVESNDLAAGLHSANATRTKWGLSTVASVTRGSGLGLGLGLVRARSGKCCASG